MSPCLVTLQPLGAQVQASMSVPQEGDLPRMFIGTGRNAALAISLAVAKARKAGFVGRHWSCPAVGLKGQT